TLYIGIGLLLGIIAGFLLNKNYVGTENERIANAEIQQKILHDKMKVYEKPSDSAAYTGLLKLKQFAGDRKKAAEKNILNESNGINAVDEARLWNDSLGGINKSLSALTDSSGA